MRKLWTFLRLLCLPGESIMARLQGSYGKRRPFEYRLPEISVEVLRKNLDEGFEALIGQIFKVKPALVRRHEEILYLFAYHDAIVATYGWSLLQENDPDQVIKDNYIKANVRLNDLLGELMGEDNSNPFTDG